MLSVIVKQVSRFSVELSVKEFGDFFLLSNQVRFFHPETGSADRCNFCRDTNLKAGKLPACVLSCPTNALVFGDLNDPNSEINKVIASNAVYREKVELGVSPKLYKVADGKGEIKS